MAALGAAHLGAKGLWQVEESLEVLQVVVTQEVAEGVHRLGGWMQVAIDVICLTVVSRLVAWLLRRLGRAFRSDESGDGPSTQFALTSKAKGREGAVHGSVSRAKDLIARELTQAPNPYTIAKATYETMQDEHAEEWEQYRSQVTTRLQARPLSSPGTRASARSASSGGPSGPTPSPGLAQSSTGCFGFVPRLRSPPLPITVGPHPRGYEPPSTAAVSVAEDTVVSSSSEATQHRLLVEAKDLGRRHKDLVARENALARGLDQVGQIRTELLAREASLAKREAEVASLRLPPTESLGVVYGFGDAAEALREWIRMIEGALRIVQVMCFTFDLDVLATCLIAARRRKVTVELMADLSNSRQCKGSLALFARMKTARIDLRIVEGAQLSDHYVHAGPTSPVHGKRGKLHAKWLRADGELIMGSANFTTSTQCNLEAVSKIRLSEEGEEKAEAFFRTPFAAAEPF